MKRKVNNSYKLLILILTIGYIWVYFNIYSNLHGLNISISCLFKNIYNIPCPSCGTTRSIISIINGQFLEALYFNPLGYFVFVLMIVLPMWILFDLLNKDITLIKHYKGFIKKNTRSKISILLITLILLNWWWNIYKNI